jgi:hypothetical protein
VKKTLNVFFRRKKNTFWRWLRTDDGSNRSFFIKRHSAQVSKWWRNLSFFRETHTHKCQLFDWKFWQAGSRVPTRSAISWVRFQPRQKKFSFCVR